MALYCTYVQNGVYNAPDDRFAQGAVFARDTAGNIRKGIVAFGANDGAATVVAGTLSVGVQAFTAVIPDASGRGAYVGGVDSATVVNALAPETTNNRVDVLCFRHLEGQSTDSGGASTLGSVTLAGQSTPITKQVVPGELYWVKGTPSASSSPPVPTVPANAVPLARVYVAGGATALTGANITDARVFTGLHGARVIAPNVSASNGPLHGWPVGVEVVNPSTGDIYRSFSTTSLARVSGRRIHSTNRDYTTGVPLARNSTWTDTAGMDLTDIRVGGRILVTLELVVDQEVSTEQTIKLDIAATGATVAPKKLPSHRFPQVPAGHAVVRLHEQFVLTATSTNVSIRISATAGLGVGRLVLPAGYITAVVD